MTTNKKVILNCIAYLGDRIANLQLLVKTLRRMHDHAEEKEISMQEADEIATFVAAECGVEEEEVREYSTRNVEGSGEGGV